MNGPEGSYGGGNALSTAAMVAAATATATATASVVALQDNNQFSSQQYPQSYQQRMMPINGMNGMNPMNNMANMSMNNMHNTMMNNMSGNMGPKMGGPTNNSMYPRRMTPYPSPAMHMSQKRGPQSYPTPGPSPNMNPNMNPNLNPNINPNINPSLNPNMNPNFSPNGQYPNYGSRQPSFQTQYPTQQALGPTGNFGPGTMTPVRTTNSLRQATPPYTTQGQYFPNGSMNQFHNNSPSQYMGGNGTGQYGNTGSQFQQDMAMRNNMSYQHSPIPGNPTPPLTPASSMPPYISPNPDVKPSFSDLKPPIPVQSK